jgi:hypothetical protein
VRSSVTRWDGEEGKGRMQDVCGEEKGKERRDVRVGWDRAQRGMAIGCREGEERKRRGAGVVERGEQCAGVPSARDGRA